MTWVVYRAGRVLSRHKDYASAVEAHLRHPGSQVIPWVQRI